MKAEYNSFESRRLLRILLLLAGLTLAGSPRLRAQCAYITNVNVSVSPAVIFVGNPTTLTLRFALNTPVSACNTNGADAFDVVWGGFGPDGKLYYVGDVWIGFGQSTGQSSVATTGVDFGRPALVAFIVGPYAPAYVEMIPPNQPALPGNLGVSPSGCNCTAGQPINLAEGNVWIPQRDYSVPGLGGGLELSRVWNSRWAYASPPALAGMFGFGWRSTYEETLAGPDSNNNLIYWRGDGSGWTFTYSDALNSYVLTSPPNVRAQLASNLTGGFILTLPDHTRKVFNSQNLLAAIIDRNGNQTTLAYNSSNHLTLVSSPGGSTLSFTYGDSGHPNQVTTVQDAVGIVATYTYGSDSTLTQVSYPDGSALNFTNDPNTLMVLSVTDGHSKLIEAHTYDSQNRGLTSTRANGVDSVSLTY